MSFSYDLSSTDATTLAISKVRMQIGDNVPGRGVLPGDDNLQDAEISTMLDEADGSIREAVISLCNVLAMRWSMAASVSVREGDKSRYEQLSDISRAWAQRAQELRRGMRISFAATPARSDGWSEAEEEGTL